MIGARARRLNVTFSIFTFEGVSCRPLCVCVCVRVVFVCQGFQTDGRANVPHEGGDPESGFTRRTKEETQKYVRICFDKEEEVWSNQ